LSPRGTWTDKAAYDRQARELAVMFEKNFAESGREASPEIKKAGPSRLLKN
jgi:phosphoenolpyruvate carboxykinase (ATP)